MENREFKFKIGAKVEFLGNSEVDKRDPEKGEKGEITQDHGTLEGHKEHYWFVEFEDGSENQMRQSELKLLK